MSRLPRVCGKDLVGALGRVGFEILRIKGSHYVLRRPDGRTTVVPVHTGEFLGPGLLRQILREADLTPEELEALI
jgi:predicted RNA binding protein YcfA (HicA-like mRNA interferase family)